MSELSDLRHRVVVLEAVAKRQADQLEIMSRLLVETAQALNRNADICTRNFELIAKANNSLAEAINKPDDDDWWKQGGGTDAESDPDIPAAG